MRVTIVYEKQIKILFSRPSGEYRQQIGDRERDESITYLLVTKLVTIKEFKSVPYESR